jgi:hypothetical protein
MSVTFNTPIRVFKRNNPSNDGTIAPDNTGAVVVSQDKAFVGGTACTLTIPAGAIIHSVSSYVSTAAGTPGTPNVTLGGTVVATLSDDAGVNAGSLAAGQAALLSNIGTTDKTLSFTAGADAEGTLLVVYTARNPDGTITQPGSGYTNN